MPIAISPAPNTSTRMTPAIGRLIPPTRPLPMASETLPPCVTAPTKPKIPTRRAARIVEIAFAPTAGAYGVAPLEPAPMTHAMNRLASAAPAKRAMRAGSINSELVCARRGRVAALAVAAPEALGVRAEEHPGERPENGDVPDAEARVGGARTDAGEPPADAEDGATDEDVPVEGLQAALEAVAGQRRAAQQPRRDEERHARHGGAAEHHEHQPEVFELEEVQDDLRPSHLAIREPEPEDEAADENQRHERWMPVTHYGLTPSAATTCAVTMATVRNARTPTMDVFEAEPTPQTPWPDVHPLPTRVPMPTKTPPTSSRHGWTSVVHAPPW
ncbi:unknown (plasmid) [Halobacterium salinarum NRC-1]|uniref:Spurious ORF n=1 Tax=Halobacterium salinarum (strain ATCC 700922 / JCM 11081 / NRC-1) TaxID=64091 RepID=O54633_HALSA|nr:unknown [Halobacterium salinarum NRC-1]AAC82947.1 unknown [Halobacterium salinarum NRC-1]DAC79523.1 TPA_inf: spurious ORF [Halobacterium salinarum NRC-1]DAC79661.1 TPA_inf: spurious ORF [Halobacterium salinarum NRC-1]